MAYLQHHELGPRNHSTCRERLRVLRVQVHAILREDWDVRPLGACKGWTTARPLAVVCWLCGKSHEV